MKKLRHLSWLFFCLSCILFTDPSYAQTQTIAEDVPFWVWEDNSISSPVANGLTKSIGSPSITADAAVLMDAGTGQVLYGKNLHQPRPIASTTKIMTALLALEGGDLKTVATVSQHAAAVGESSIHLEAGEKLSLEQLLYGALVRSGNDACVAIAEQIAGSEQNFVRLMNEKAFLLGAENTNFCNTNGLPAAEHKSTAYDLAVLARYAINNPVFNKIVCTRGIVLSGPDARERHLSNTNQLLWSYEGADGIKTGTTNAAGQCLVASATRGERRLISVVLHSDNRYKDSISLLNYGFANYESIPVVNQGEAYSRVDVKEGVTESVPLVSDRDISVSVPRNEQGTLEKTIHISTGITAPVNRGAFVGKLIIMVDKKPVARAKLLTSRPVDRLPIHRLVFNQIRCSFRNIL